MTRPRDDMGEEMVSASVSHPDTGTSVGFVVWESEDDLKAVNEMLRTVWDGEHLPSITSVPDTGDDSTIFVISKYPLTPGETQSAWDDYEANYLHDDLSMAEAEDEAESLSDPSSV